MMRAHDDVASLAQREADIAATTAMDEAELQGDEPTWARFGYAIAVIALVGVGIGFAYGLVKYVFAR